MSYVARARASAIAVILSVVALIALPASAANPVNGVIKVKNFASYAVHVSVQYNYHEIDGATLRPGETWISSRCCFAAYTEYRLQADVPGPNGERYLNPVFFRPDICNAPFEGSTFYAKEYLEIGADGIVRDPEIGPGACGKT